MPSLASLACRTPSLRLFVSLLVLAAVGCHGRGIKKQAATCPAPQSTCSGPSGQPVCAQLQTDVANCGTCGVSCGPGEVCVRGQCSGYCPTPYQSCPDLTGKPVCRDLAVDVEHCGACGAACPRGQVCSQAACSLQCAPPQALCTSSRSPTGLCTNLQNDNLNCGSCNLICPGGQACIDGRCGPCNRTTIPGGVMLLDFGAKPSSLEIADLDRDGVLDLVALSTSENTVTLRLGSGDGTFAERQAIITGKEPKTVAVGDFDGDYQTDLAIANTGSRDLVVLSGVPGARTWRESLRLNLPSAPVALATGDLDQDGLADLVLAVQGPPSAELLLRLSSKSGTAWESLGQPLQGTPTGVHLADLDGDGRPDLVVSLQEGSVVTGLTGSDGKPQTLRRFATGPGCVAVMAVDLNDDNRLDLVTSSNGDNSIRVLRGQGDGSFAEASRTSLGSSPTGLSAADVDGDGKLDVLTGSPAEHGIRVLPGRGDGTVGTTQLILAGSNPVEIRAVDLNRDHKPDLVAAHASDKGRALSIILARDTGVYALPTKPLSDAPFALRMLDLDGDGKQDLVLLGSKLSILRGTGKGSFGTPTVHDMGNVGTMDMAVTDLNQDGKPDVAVATTKALMIFLNDGNGGMAAPKTVPLQSSLYSFAVGDINHDGRPDFAFDYEHGIDLLMATASGDYQSKSLLYGSCGCDYRPSMRLVDLNLDGHLDLLTLSDDTYAYLDAWLGDGTGEFTRLGTGAGAGVTGESPRFLGIVQPPEKRPPGLMVVARGGLSMSSMELGSIASYLGHGDGTFALGTKRSLEALAGEGALVDFDQDGLIDALVPLTTPMGAVGLNGRQRVWPEYVEKTDNSVALMRGLQDGGLAPWLAYWLDSPASAVGAADLNGDGSLDIVTAHDVTTPSLTILLTQVTPCR